MKHKVGIIVPVYNAEKYLSDCINSILGQRYENFRLILVNDGSKDCSGNICDSFKEQDKRITVVHKENGGANSARAVGVKYATDCDYITFVDSDDKLYDYSIECLVSSVNDDVDIVVAPLDNKSLGILQNETIDIETYRRRLVSMKIIWSPCAKLYKKGLFNKKVFDMPYDINRGEDFLMNIAIAFNAIKDVCIVTTPCYIYRCNINSVSKTTKLNISYHNNFYKQLILTIPAEKINNYTEELILLRLKILNQYTTSFSTPQYFDKEIYTTLIKDLSTSKYKLNFIQHSLLFCKNNILRCALLFMYKIYKRFLKRF